VYLAQRLDDTPRKKGARSLRVGVLISDSIDSKTAWHHAQGAEANADGEPWQVVKLRPGQVLPGQVLLGCIVPTSGIG